jgi:hypothetical protein
MREPFTHLGLRLPLHLDAQLTACAKLQKTTVSAVMRTALAQYLAQIQPIPVSVGESRETKARST